MGTHCGVIRFVGTAFLWVCANPVSSDGAELTVHDVTVARGGTAGVIVSGRIDGESTFGVTVMIEIAPRPGAVGTVRFTPAPPLDIIQLIDPWPGVGIFMPFDTDVTGSDLLNGSDDDNGTYIPAPVTFAGDLGSYPIAADENARGIWDVRLSTSVGDSNWQGLPTTLTSGTVTVVPPEGVPATSAWAHVVTVLLLVTAGCVIAPRRRRHVRTVHPARTV